MEGLIIYLLIGLVLNSIYMIVEWYNGRPVKVGDIMVFPLCIALWPLLACMLIMEYKDEILIKGRKRG